MVANNKDDIGIEKRDSIFLSRKKLKEMNIMKQTAKLTLMAIIMFAVSAVSAFSQANEAAKKTRRRVAHQGIKEEWELTKIQLNTSLTPDTFKKKV